MVESSLEPMCLPVELLDADSTKQSGRDVDTGIGKVVLIVEAN